MTHQPRTYVDIDLVLEAVQKKYEVEAVSYSLDERTNRRGEKYYVAHFFGTSQTPLVTYVYAKKEGEKILILAESFRERTNKKDTVIERGPIAQVMDILF